MGKGGRTTRRREAVKRMGTGRSRRPFPTLQPGAYMLIITMTFVIVCLIVLIILLSSSSSQRPPLQRARQSAPELSTLPWGISLRAARDRPGARGRPT
eukprot:283843-Pyramimonas_sp.AAC.1